MNLCKKCGWVGDPVDGWMCAGCGFEINPRPNLTDKIEPCPNCGSKDDLRLVGDAAVRCARCGTSNIIRVWNLRPIEEKLKHRIEVLEAVLAAERIRVPKSEE